MLDTCGFGESAAPHGWMQSILEIRTDEQSTSHARVRGFLEILIRGASGNTVDLDEDATKCIMGELMQMYDNRGSKPFKKFKAMASKIRILVQKLTPKNATPPLHAMAEA